MYSKEFMAGVAVGRQLKGWATKNGEAPTPTGTIEINTNGLHDVSTFAFANVNVMQQAVGIGKYDPSNFVSGSIIGPFEYPDKCAELTQVQNGIAQAAYIDWRQPFEIGLCFYCSQVTSYTQRILGHSGAGPMIDISYDRYSASYYFGCASGSTWIGITPNKQQYPSIVNEWAIAIIGWSNNQLYAELWKTAGRYYYGTSSMNMPTAVERCDIGWSRANSSGHNYVAENVRIDMSKSWVSLSGVRIVGGHAPIVLWLLLCFLSFGRKVGAKQ